jgi:plastocyanin
MRPSRTGRALAAAAALALPLLLGAAAPAPTVVKIDNFTFAPATLTVRAGTTVTWVNDDDIPHAVAADDHSFKSKVMDTQDRFSTTFAKPGTYGYFCSLHPHMTGKVVVTGP